MTLYSIESVIGLAVGAAALGALIAFLLSRRGSSKKRLQDLESRLEVTQEELEGARSELTDYRQDVFEQFSETAVKFKALNDTYSDLHQQLANSARLLCGDEAKGVLLEGPQMLALGSAPADVQAADQTDVEEVPDADEGINPDAEIGDEFEQQNAFGELTGVKPDQVDEDLEADSASIVEEAPEKTRGKTEPAQADAEVIDPSEDEIKDPPSAIVGRERPSSNDLERVDEEIVVEEVPVLSDIATSEEAAKESQIDGQVPTSTIERALNVRRDKDRHQRG